MDRVLILCTGNSCRSQMAEGFLNTLGKGQFQAFSAGTHPSTVNPLAIRAMAEMEVDISGYQSEGVDVYAHQGFDYVITVCDRARGNCPVFPGATQQVHWSFDDPAEAEGIEEECMSVFRRVRDEIRARIEGFVGEV